MKKREILSGRSWIGFENKPKARGTKQKARVDAFKEIKKTASQKLDEDELDLPVKMERLGSKIVEFHKIGKAFGELKILKNFSYNVQRKERMGIVGKNGTGKTTFLKMLLGTESIDKGKIVVGETVVFGHFSQDLIKVNDDFKVIDVVKEVAEFIPLEKGKQLSAAQLLERFLFPRSMHYNYVRKLSGGEKRRLKLLRVLMSNPNFLILDEPTNDLDIFAMAVLEEYLRNFQGCLIVVSHDRYFMDKMVDHLLVFQGDGVVKDILGNYTDFRKQEKQIEKENKVVSQNKEAQHKNKSASKVKTKLSFKENEEFKQLEIDLEKLEIEKADLTEGLSDETRTNAELYDMGKRLGEVVDLIDQKTERWMELAEYV